MMGSMFRDFFNVIYIYKKKNKHFSDTLQRPKF